LQDLTYINGITQKIIGICCQVHSNLGPGLLESSYKACLEYELSSAGMKVEMEKPLPLIYKEVKLDIGYRIDLFVERLIIVEIKAVESLTDVHTAQVLTYMKLTGSKVGLLVNFNVIRLVKGLRRLIL
jgi:GxxExxY protein